MDSITRKLVETVRQITESDAFGTGGPPLPPPTKTPRQMTDDELDQASAFGMNGSSEPYIDELRLRYGPNMKYRVPPGTPSPDPPPMKIPAYLQGQTDTVRFPELHSVYGLTPKPPVG
jgi:hypothetical protein